MHQLSIVHKTEAPASDPAGVTPGAPSQSRWNRAVTNRVAVQVKPALDALCPGGVAFLDGGSTAARTRAAGDQFTAMRRLLFCIAAALLLALASAGFLQLRHRQTAALRLAQWQAERDEDAIPPVLAREFQWQRADLTLAQFADLLAANSGLRVELDEGGIQANGRW